MPVRLPMIWPSHFSSVYSFSYYSFKFSFTYAAVAPLIYIPAPGPLHQLLLSGMLFSQIARWLVFWSFSWFCSNVTFSLGPCLHAVYFNMPPSPLSVIPFPALFESQQLAPSNMLVILFTVFLLPSENELCKSRDILMFYSPTIESSALSMVGTH